MEGYYYAGKQGQRANTMSCAELLAVSYSHFCATATFAQDSHSVEPFAL